MRSAALQAMRPVAARVRDEMGVAEEEPWDPVRSIERTFRVACVSVPDLCIASARIWMGRHARHIPAELLKPAVGEDVYRPLRGACIAWRGVGLLLADEADPYDEQRFSFAHEGAHFLTDHHLPRRDVLDRLGSALLEVLDGHRPPTLRERADAALRRTRLTWHTHLYVRDQPQHDLAEEHADALACLLMASPDAISVGVGAWSTDVACRLQSVFGLPAHIARAYASALTDERLSRRHPLLQRLGL